MVDGGIGTFHCLRESPSSGSRLGHKKLIKSFLKKDNYEKGEKKDLVSFFFLLFLFCLPKKSKKGGYFTSKSQ